VQVTFYSQKSKLFHPEKDKASTGIQENVACARGLYRQDLKMFFISSGRPYLQAKNSVM